METQVVRVALAAVEMVEEQTVQQQACLEPPIVVVGVEERKDIRPLLVDQEL